MFTRLKNVPFLAVLPLALVLPSTAQVQLIEITEFTGIQNSPPLVSPDGLTVAGTTLDSQGLRVTFRWTEVAGLVEVRDPDYPSRKVNLRDVSLGGLVLGSGNSALGSPFSRRYKADGTSPALETPAGALFSFGAASREDGLRTFGGAFIRYSSALQDWRPVIWNADEQVEEILTQYADGTPLTGADDFRACSGDGMVAVGFASIWRAGVGLKPFTIPVAPPSTSTLSTAFCLSHDGRYLFGPSDVFGPSVRWDQQETFATPLGTAPDGFLFNVSNCTSDGDMAVGSSHFWRPETGTVQLAEYVASLGAPLGSWHGVFVGDVSADGTVMVGMGFDASGLSKHWLIRFHMDWWTNEGRTYCSPSVPNSTGDTARITAFGSTAIALNSLRLEAHGLPANAFGYFLASQTQRFTPLAGGSQGNLCLGGDIGRYVGPGQILNSGSEERMLLELDLNAIPTPTGLVSGQPGETWNFQLWHRDAVAGQLTSNFSDAVSVTLQ